MEQDDEEHEMVVVTHGLAKAAELLAKKYHWIITNVPYLARGKQNETLRDFCEKNYKAAKKDLATVFLHRCLEFCVKGATCSVVLPQNWLFLTTYQNGESAAGDRLSAAQGLQKKLELILEGETLYDIFVRWNPIEAQPVGWNPDLNDGIRLNIRPFMEANIFRKKPKIKWGKDRGKNPPGSFWGEERINDRHLTLDEKIQAQKVEAASSRLR